ncbi:MAG: shikimate kinase [Planctomycetaceae bacterium]
MNLYLIGYRGSGKTTVAAELSLLLSLPWVDADQKLVEAAGKSITQIFAEVGEPGFRDLESQTLRSLASKSGQIVALGGGVILRPENREILKQTGKAVWLTAPPEVLAERIQLDAATKANRPSLTSQGVLGEIQTVLQQRLPLYEEAANWSIAVDQHSPIEVARQIAQWWKKAALDIVGTDEGTAHKATH